MKQSKMLLSSIYYQNSDIQLKNNIHDGQIKANKSQRSLGVILRIVTASTFQILNHEPDPYDKRLKKDEIDEYKSHYLYLRLFDNNTRHFYHFYNSASLNKSSDQQQYSMKMNQQQEKQSNRRVKLEQLTGKCKIQSLRHRMKEQQAIFHNPMTMKFSYEDREVDEDDVEIEKFKQLCLLK